jgi:hypothetical protein
MALPSSGQISISDIYTEVTQSGQVSNYSLSRLSKGDWNSKIDLLNGYPGIDQNSTSKPDRVAQHEMSNFHSYNHTQNGSCSGTSFGDVLSGFDDPRRSYHRINATGTAGDIVVITVGCPKREGSEPFGPFSYGYYYIFDVYPFDYFGTLLVGSAIYSGITDSSSRTDYWYYTLSGTSQVIYIVTYADAADYA